MSVGNLENMNSSATEQAVINNITNINKHGISVDQADQMIEVGKDKRLREKSADYTMLTTNQDQYAESWILDTSSNAINLTFATGSDYPEGREVTFYAISASNDATLKLGSNQVDGSSSDITITNGSPVVLLHVTGNTWYRKQ